MHLDSPATTHPRRANCAWASSTISIRTTRPIPLQMLPSVHLSARFGIGSGSFQRRVERSTILIVQVVASDHLQQHLSALWQLCRFVDHVTTVLDSGSACIVAILPRFAQVRTEPRRRAHPACSPIARGDLQTQSASLKSALSCPRLGERLSVRLPVATLSAVIAIRPHRRR
jgi:hypothetical protein